MDYAGSITSRLPKKPKQMSSNNSGRCSDAHCHSKMVLGGVYRQAGEHKMDKAITRMEMQAFQQKYRTTTEGTISKKGQEERGTVHYKLVRISKKHKVNQKSPQNLYFVVKRCPTCFECMNYSSSTHVHWLSFYKERQHNPGCKIQLFIVMVFYILQMRKKNLTQKTRSWHDGVEFNGF